MNHITHTHSYFSCL